jgi:hypothetical protein
MIDKCDELWVLELEGWRTSRGVSAEIEYALTKGKTVRYLSYPDLRETGHITSGKGIKAMTEALFQADKKFESQTDTTYAAGSCPDCGAVVNPRYIRCWPCFHKTLVGQDCKAVGCPQHEESDFGLVVSEVPDIEPVAEPTKQLIIGLNGVARSGKDTVGEYLVENHDFTRVALADPVRDALYDLNPPVTVRIDDDIFSRPGLTRRLAIFSEQGQVKTISLQRLVDIFGWERAKSVKCVRELLQKLGTQVGREYFGEDCWIEIARAKIEAAYPDPVVITDVRFENEAEFIQELGGEVWCIKREGVGAINGHVSEQALYPGNVDLYIANNDTLDYLYRIVDISVGDIKKAA